MTSTRGITFRGGGQTLHLARRSNVDAHNLSIEATTLTALRLEPSVEEGTRAS